MILEWDDAKRKLTLEQRGLDFADIALVNWAEALTDEDTRTVYAEQRFVTMAPINGRLYIFAWCLRESAMRIISFRKANDRERKRYAEALYRT
jgi:uncharacterized DUF497 family protein